jgi:hypothetical protein
VGTRVVTFVREDDDTVAATALRVSREFVLFTSDPSLPASNPALAASAVLALLGRHQSHVAATSLLTFTSRGITLALPAAAAAELQAPLAAQGVTVAERGCVLVSVFSQSAPPALSLATALFSVQSTNVLSVLLAELSAEDATALHTALFTPVPECMVATLPLSMPPRRACEGRCTDVSASLDATDNVLTTPPTERWWWKQQAALSELAPLADPVYVYNLDTVTERAQQLQAHNTCDQTFYAVKANYHPGVLRTLEAAGVGFECVSQREVEHVVALFPEIGAQNRLLFTANFAPRGEYERAFALGAHVTIDNAYCLEAWPEVFTGRNVILRIDPGLVGWLMGGGGCFALFGFFLLFG